MNSLKCEINFWARMCSIEYDGFKNKADKKPIVMKYPSAPEIFHVIWRTSRYSLYRCADESHKAEAIFFFCMPSALEVLYFHRAVYCGHCMTKQQQQNL